ncbi:hypothetical protein [Streptomyces pseudovenezuelae]|uniref:hypothetical protein n=2 Tax=Streptomyces TaxID=1883 RepID=UPI00371028A4
MTTPMPPLTLVRHYCETRRELLGAAGFRMKPWFRLINDGRAVAVPEASLITEALHRADCRRTGLLLGDGGANPVIDAEVVCQVAEVRHALRMLSQHRRH